MTSEKMLEIVVDALRTAKQFMINSQDFVSSWGALSVALVALVVALAALLHDRQQTTLQGLDFRIMPKRIDVTKPIPSKATQLVIGIHAVGPGTRYGVSLHVWGPKEAVEVVRLSEARETWGPGDPPMLVVLQRPGGPADAEMDASSKSWKARDVMVGLSWAVPGWPRAGLRDRALRVHIAAPGKSSSDAWDCKYEKWAPRRDKWVPYYLGGRSGHFAEELKIGLHTSSQQFGAQDIAAIEEAERAEVDEQYDQKAREIRQRAIDQASSRSNSIL